MFLFIILFFNISSLHNISQTYFMTHKLLTKITGALGYKLIEKKHFKNNRLLSKDTALNMHKLLKSIFFNNAIKQLIQIGANDGKSFDNLNYFIKKNHTKSLLVEPIKDNFDKLKENYKDYKLISLENSAISVNNEITYLYKVNPIYENHYGNHIPAIPSFEKNHLIKHGVKNNHIITEKINAISIKDLIKKYDIKDFDLLFLDAEGYDGKIVFDFLSTVKMRPIIIFEYIHLDNSFFESLIKKVKDENYVFFSIDENMLCYPKEKKINFELN